MPLKSANQVYLCHNSSWNFITSYISFTAVVSEEKKPQIKPAVNHS